MLASPATTVSSFLIREPAEVYHARRATHLTSHLLGDFRRCPQLFRRKRLGLIPDEDRPAYLVGRAAHTAILEGKDAFQDSFAVGGPLNPKTGQPYGVSTKTWAEWAEAQGKPVLTPTQHELVQNLSQAVARQNIAQELLSVGQAESVVRAEYGEVACQIRMDWFDVATGITDLKTVDALEYFEADARRYGYVHQLAFYRGVLQAASGLKFTCQFIAVEKKEPFRAGVWLVTGDVLDYAERENLAAIKRLRRCKAQEHWPTGYEDLRFFDSL